MNKNCENEVDNPMNWMICNTFKMKCTLNEFKWISQRSGAPMDSIVNNIQWILFIIQLHM